MKYILFPLFIFIGLSSIFAQQQSIHPCAKHKIAHAQQMKSGQKALNGQEKYDLHYVKLDLDVANTSTTINSGHAMLNGEVVAFSLDIFVLELASSLQVDSAKLDGVLAPINRIGDELQVFPPTNLNQGENFSLDVYYRGNPPGGEVSLVVYSMLPPQAGVLKLPGRLVSPFQHIPGGHVSKS